MDMMYLQIWKSVIVAFFMITGMLGGCESSTEPPPEEEPEPYFKPGEYGGDPLEGTEHLYNFQLSPDGTQMALIRAYTPGKPLAPRDQLWILNADGTEPKLIGYNIGTVDWSPDGDRLGVSFMPGAPYTYVFTISFDSMQARQWTGFPKSFFTKQTASNAQWFPDDRRLLISVWGKAYQQPYERGLYILDSFDSSVQGPLVEVASGGFLGNYTNYLIARKNLK